MTLPRITLLVALAAAAGGGGQTAPESPPPPPADFAVSTPHEAYAPAPYAQWALGPATSPEFFPIAVWLQDPKHAARYRQAGFNLYVGLWKGPTEQQLGTLAEAGMRVICAQNDVGLEHLEDPVIAGWLHGDEPDNAQPLPDGGYGPPIPPEVIAEDYARIARRDPKRPVLLNLGQGVAWDGWHGRGVRTRHPEDYPEYAEGCDIVSFDIYPAVHSKREVQGALWYVPYGVKRLRDWTEDRKVVWNCLECTRISNPSLKPTPAQVAAEAWLSVIHGSRGLVYFVHQFEPTFRAAALFDDTEMLAAVTALNARITRLAPVINSKPVVERLKLTTANRRNPVQATVREHDGALYVLAAGAYQEPTTATFTLEGLASAKTVEVLDEDRSIPLRDGCFRDEFDGYAVHLYRLR